LAETAVWLAVARTIHFLSVSALFGAALFPFYGFDPKHAVPDAIARRLSRLLKWLALFALFSAFLWFAILIAANPMSNRLVSIWVIRVTCSGLLIYFLWFETGLRRRRFVLIASAALLVSLAGLGHDGTRNAAAASAHVVVDVIHLLASAIWVGALFKLLLLAPSGAPDEAALFHEALMRFSGVGPVVVIVLAMSGLANGGLIGPQNALQSFTNSYSQVLLLKIGLFLLMLALAAANRYWLTPMLRAGMASAAGADESLRALRASIIAESALAVLVIAAVGVLGVLPVPGTK
jgi:putative copper resistance protein D